MKRTLPHLITVASAVLAAFGVMMGEFSARAAESPPRPFQKITEATQGLPFEIWFRGTSMEMPDAWATWKGDLHTIATHPLFEGRLPPLTSILIDPSWNIIGGYYISSLQGPDGTPAVLASPSSISGNTVADTQLLSHELTHLIHDRMRPQEEAWVREGVALLVEYRVTDHRDPSMIEALREPETSLVADLNLTEANHYRNKASLPQYGHLAQYFDYIYRLCGGDTLLNTLLSSPSHETGVVFVDTVLRGSGIDEPACQGFEASFKRFERARFMDSPYSADGYVFHSPVRARLQAGPKFELPPYSAGAYTRPVGKRCARGDEEWNEDRCMRIRRQ